MTRPHVIVAHEAVPPKICWRYALYRWLDAQLRERSSCEPSRAGAQHQERDGAWRTTCVARTTQGARGARHALLYENDYV